MLQSKAKRILAARLKAELGGTDTQAARAKLAQRSGLSPRSVGYLMSDSDGNPTLDSLEKVADALGISVSELLRDPAQVGAEGKSGEEWTGFDHPERLTAALIDWGEKATPTSKNVISELVDHVRQGDLPDDFWETIRWLAKRYNNNTK